MNQREHTDMAEDDLVDYRNEPINENNLSSVIFEYWVESTIAAKSRIEWLKKLGLESETKTNEIEKALDRAIQSGTELEKINAHANLAALTSRAEKYEDGVSSILLANLDKPNCMEERVRLSVWRHILKANEFKTPKEEYQINHNQQLLKKIAEIDRVLKTEFEQLAPQAQQTEALAVEAVSQSARGERDLTKWMRETWIAEGKPTGAPFFDALKKYVMQPGSPIREHYTTGPEGAGIRWTTGSATNYMKKKNIQTMASKFKNKQNNKAVNS